MKSSGLNAREVGDRRLGIVAGRHGGPARLKSRPIVSLGLRALVLLVPLAAGWIGVKSSIAFVPRPDGRVAFSMWMAGLSVVSFVASLGVQRIMRQLAPMAMLFKMSLVFPDEAA